MNAQEGFGDIIDKRMESVREQQEQEKKAAAAARGQVDQARQKAANLRNQVVKPMLEEATAALKRKVGIPWGDPSLHGDLNDDTFSAQCRAGQNFPGERQFGINARVVVENNGEEFGLFVECHLTDIRRTGVNFSPGKKVKPVTASDDEIRELLHEMVAQCVLEFTEYMEKYPNR